MPSNSASNMTRLLPSMLAILTRHPRRRLRSWFNATKRPTRGFGKHSTVWRSVRAKQLFGGQHG
jgi:hypothetical protein